MGASEGPASKESGVVSEGSDRRGQVSKSGPLDFKAVLVSQLTAKLRSKE